MADRASNCEVRGKRSREGADLLERSATEQVCDREEQGGVQGTEVVLQSVALVHFIRLLNTSQRVSPVRHTQPETEQASNAHIHVHSFCHYPHGYFPFPLIGLSCSWQHLHVLPPEIWCL